MQPDSGPTQLSGQNSHGRAMNTNARISKSFVQSIGNYATGAYKWPPKCPETLRFSEKPIRLNDREKVTKFLNESDSMVYRGYHIHESDRDRTLMERKEHYEDRRNTFNFTKKDELLRPATSRLSQYHKHFNYSAHTVNSYIVHDCMLSAAQMAENILKGEYDNPTGKILNRVEFLGDCRFKNLPDRHHPFHPAIFENVKIPLVPITMEWDLETNEIPTFEGNLDYGFALIDRAHKNSLKKPLQVLPEAKDMVAGVMVYDSEEEMLDRDWEWRATVSALQSSSTHPSSPWARKFPLAVTNGHYWNFYEGRRLLIPSIGDLGVDKTLSPLSYTKDRRRIVEILKDMILFDYSPHLRRLSREYDNLLMREIPDDLSLRRPRVYNPSTSILMLPSCQ